MKYNCNIGTAFLCFVIGFCSCQGNAKTFERYQIIEVGGVADYTDDDLYSKFDISPDDEDFEILYRNRRQGTAQFLVKPDLLEKFEDVVTINNFLSKTIFEDIESSIQISKNLRANSEDLNGESTFDRYMDFSEIQKYLSKLQQTYPNKVKLSTIGRSYKNDSITMVTITNGVNRSTRQRPIIFIEAGMHAREWIGVASALYVINELVRGAGTPFTKFVEWRIVPVSNPDGYQYTWTTNRLWRKNLRRNLTGGRCSGVDLNRNFETFWGVSGSSKRECSQIYAGKKAFSEPETRAIRDAFLEASDNLQAYISIHSFGQFILHPPSHSGFEVNEGCSKLLNSVAIEMAGVIKNLTSLVFTHGPPPKLLYPASGTSMDWAYANGNVPFIFTFELRDEGKAGFLLPEDQIYFGVTEFWEALNVVYVRVVDALKAPSASCSPNPPTTPIPSPPSESQSSRRLTILSRGIFNERFRGRDEEVHMFGRSKSSEEELSQSSESEEELKRVWF